MGWGAFSCSPSLRMVSGPDGLLGSGTEMVDFYRRVILKADFTSSSEHLIKRQLQNWIRSNLFYQVITTITTGENPGSVQRWGKNLESKCMHLYVRTQSQNYINM